MADGFDALDVAREQRDHYYQQVTRTRWKYYASEVSILVVSAAVTVTGVLIPGDARAPACLGAAVATLIGLRSVFHWRENWTRSAMATSQINAEMRLYQLRAAPYDQTASRDTELIARLNALQAVETQAWVQVADPNER